MMKEETTYHIPVLLMPSVDAMNIRPDGTYVDVTFGGGGHSREILSRLEDGGRLLSFDQDEDAERNIVNNPHFTFVRSNFRYLHNFLRYHGIEKVDAILADLGVSSHHFDDSERGFSFRFDGALDMRMNKRAGLTAADIVNTYEEEKLADIFYLYGELKNSRKLASVIVKARATQRIATIGEFLEIVKPLFGREREKKELAKVFQALRIEVNQEVGVAALVAGAGVDEGAERRRGHGAELSAQGLRGSDHLRTQLLRGWVADDLPGTVGMHHRVLDLVTVDVLRAIDAEG